MSYQKYQSDPLQEVKVQMEQTKEVMRDNIDKMIERKENLYVIERKTEDLSETANIFEESATRLKRKICLRRIKWFGCFVLTFGLFLFIVIYLSQK